MRRQLLPVFLLMISILYLTESLRAQKYSIDNPHIDYVKIEAPAPMINKPIPFATIHVHDKRFDTSCLGIMNRYSSDRLAVLAVKNGVADITKRYYESAFAGHAVDTVAGELHCFIRKALLSDHIVVHYPEEETLLSRKFEVEERSGILFRAEYFLKTNKGYLPLLRFDTTITGPRTVSRDGDIYLSGALWSSLQKISSVDWAKKKQTGTALTNEQVQQYYDHPFSLPILSAPVVAKGIFLRFEDFKQNKITPLDFTVDKKGKGDFLYVKNAKGEEQLLTELWGYSDGNDCFMYTANNYFKLHRTGNTFKLYGAKDYTAIRNLRPNFGLIDLFSPKSNYSKGQTVTRYYLIESYFILDMETGELY